MILVRDTVVILIVVHLITPCLDFRLGPPAQDKLSKVEQEVPCNWVTIFSGTWIQNNLLDLSPTT